MAFHITEDGPKPCSTQPEKCPITRKTGAEHYETQEQAQKVYELAMKEQNLPKLVQQKAVSTKAQTNNTSSSIIDKNLPQTIVHSNVAPQKGGSYYGSSIPVESIETHREAWINVVGEKEAELMENAKIERDGGYHFHITTLTPKETRTLYKEGKKNNVDVKKALSEIPDADYTFKGIGSVEDEQNDKKAWYIVVESSNLDKWRKENNLPKKDFHITLGFVNGDVHTMSKNSDTLRIV